MVFKVACLMFMVIGLAELGVLPVEKCSLEDSSCMLSAFQKMVPVFVVGMPDANVEVLDIMEMDDLKFDLSGFQFSLKEGRLQGLKYSVIDEVIWDTKEKMFSIDFHLDAIVTGHYVAGGRVLILPISGDGQITLKMKHVQTKIFFYYDLVKGQDGKDHIKLQKFLFEFDVKENVHFHLTNLFNNNKELTEKMLNFLNKNWKQISEKFGRPIVQVATEKLYRNMGNFFDVMPLEEIANV